VHVHTRMHASMYVNCGNVYVHVCIDHNDSRRESDREKREDNMRFDQRRRERDRVCVCERVSFEICQRV